MLPTVERGVLAPGLEAGHCQNISTVHSTLLECFLALSKARRHRFTTVTSSKFDAYNESQVCQDCLTRVATSEPGSEDVASI